MVSNGDNPQHIYQLTGDSLAMLNGASLWVANSGSGSTKPSSRIEFDLKASRIGPTAFLDAVVAGTDISNHGDPDNVSAVGVEFDFGSTTRATNLDSPEELYINKLQKILKA